jgi:hypothetical protein
MVKSDWGFKPLYDVVWTWDKFMSVAIACRRTGVPMVQSLHDTWGEGKLGRGALRSLGYAIQLTTNSEATKAQFVAHSRRASKAKVILGGRSRGCRGCGSDAAPT